MFAGVLHTGMRAGLSITGLALSVLVAACTSSTATTTSPTTTPTTEVTSPLPDALVPAVSDKTELSVGGPVPAGAPDAVADRVPLPYCGATLRSPSSGVNPFPAIELVDDADDCYRSRAEAGQPAEMIEIGWTSEGDPILTVRRVLPDGREETFSA